MRYFLLTLISQALIHSCLAQIIGKVQEPGGEPVPFATIILMTGSDSTMVGSAITNATGDFSIETFREGDLRLKVSSIGYQTWYSDVIEMLKNINGGSTAASLRKHDVGVIMLTSETQQLNEVVVEGQRPILEQSNNGIVVNVESSIMTKGSTVLQLLERSPGVRIDRQNNTIELNGKNGVMVMINGKLLRLPVEQLVSLLSGMSGNDIVTIELLTTPPAGFDAEGSGGVINITTRKRNVAGTSGSVSVTGGHAYGEKLMTGGTINHSTQTTNIEASYNFARDRVATDFLAIGHEEEPMLGGYAASEFQSRSTALQNSHTATGGFDSHFKAGTTLGTRVNYGMSASEVKTLNQGSYHIEPDSLYLLRANTGNGNRWRTIIMNVFADQQFKKGGKLSADLDYLGYQNKYPTYGVNSFVSSGGAQAGTNDTLFSPVVRGFSKTIINVSAVKVDYTQPLSNGWNFETGVKATGTRTVGMSSVQNLIEGEYVTRQASVNNMTMREGIAAGFVTVSTPRDSTLQVSAGVRFEYSRTLIENSVTNAAIADRKLGVFFPTILISRKLTTKSGIELSYTKRITRPSYTDLSSFVTPNGPTSVNTGNPLLRPTISNIIRVGYHHSGYLISMLLSRDTYPIARYQIVYTKDKTQQAVSPQNLEFQNNLTFQTSIPVNINRWFTMNYGFVGGWRNFKLTYTQEPVEKTYFAYTLQGSETFEIPGGWAVELSGYYNSDSYNGSRKTNGYGVVNFGVKKEFRRAGALSLSLSDVFRTSAVTSYFGALTREAFDLQTKVVYHPESSLYQAIRLTYTWTFGSGSKINGRNESIESERLRAGN